MRSRWLRLTVALGGLGLAVAVGISVGTSAGETAESAGDSVDASFTYFDGTPGALSDFRGTPVVVNFWASWCPACVAEMPDFEAVHQQFAGEVEFLGLNMQEVDKGAALTLVEQTGVSYTLAEDPQGEIYRQFGGIAMPTTVFLDAEGRVVDVHAGVLFAEDLARIVEELFLS